MNIELCTKCTYICYSKKINIKYDQKKSLFIKNPIVCILTQKHRLGLYGSSRQKDKKQQ